MHRFLRPIDATLWQRLIKAFQGLAHGVIGNTADFGSVVQGSSPCGPTQKPPQIRLRGLSFYNDPLLFSIQPQFPLYSVLTS